MKVGIGFVTGRKNFKHIVKTYIDHCHTHEPGEGNEVSLNLFVAYDLEYTGTKISDYKKIDPDDYNRVDSITFIGKSSIQEEVNRLIRHGVLNSREAKMIFGDGYGKKRNLVTYFAIKNRMDYLLFIDDDEYPVAPIKGRNSGIAWIGQELLKTHLRYISSADITNGHHCGYISPIPYIQYNDLITGQDLQLLIEALSNDILNWESIKAKMENGGITFADTRLLEEQMAVEVEERNGAKFISGSNLCLNLSHPEKLPPFYNPPKARGEDTFFSTCLSGLTVLRVPCYTFHDGFLNYSCILHGILPGKLKPVTHTSLPHIKRFLKAAIGWARYKPLYLYITQRRRYESEIERAREYLARVIPKFCRYFGMQEFESIKKELENYHQQVKAHFDEFEETRSIWKRVTAWTKEAGFREESTRPDCFRGLKGVMRYQNSSLNTMIGLGKNRSSEFTGC